MQSNGIIIAGVAMGAAAGFGLTAASGRTFGAEKSHFPSAAGAIGLSTGTGSLLFGAGAITIMKSGSASRGMAIGIGLAAAGAGMALGGLFASPFAVGHDPRAGADLVSH